MKRYVSIVWSVTVFMVFILSSPSNACVASTNYFPVCEGHGNKSDLQLINEWVYHRMPVSEAKIVPSVDERAPTQTEQGKLLAPVIFFLIILAVTAYIVYQLVKLLDKVIPPPDQQPDPPPNSGNTNYPPITINPTHGPGPAPATLGKSLTVTSNTPSWGTITNYDITALNYRNQCEKFQAPVYFDRFWSTSMKTTIDGVNWKDTNYRIDCYVSSTAGAVYYAYYHYGTNWWNCYYTTAYIATNHAAPAWFDLTDEPRQVNQFFRLDPK